MTIYFDMDGVLADFDGYLRAHNMPHKPMNSYNPQVDDLMWTAIRSVPHFYLQLAPNMDAVQLFNTMRVKYNCEVLTAKPAEKRGITTAEEDKREWVHRYLGADVKVNVTTWRDKKNYCVGKGSILLDDFNKTVEAWNAAGGTGILYTTAGEALRQLMPILR